MKNGTEQIWSRLRGVFVDELTFSEIKNVAGSAGIPISGLAHLVQQDGATKDALMSAVDGLFAKLPTEEQDGFVADFVREAVERKSRVRERIEPLLERLGCSIDEENQLIRTDVPTPSKSQQSGTQPMQPVIFISHSSKNLEVGDAILRLLKDAFGLRASELRYTSHPAYGLSGGADPGTTLRQEVVAAKLVIGLITTESVESQYVLFELGARWGAEKPLIPLLASGSQSSQLPKPLSAHALTCDNEDSLLRFIKDCGAIIERQADDPSAYMQSLRAVVAASKRTPSAEQVNRAPLSEVAEEILAAIQSEQDSDSRGVTEILKSPEFNKSFFFAKLTNRGSPYSVPTPQFRRAIRELSEAGWLDEPEDDGNVRVYRYVAQ